MLTSSLRIPLNQCLILFEVYDEYSHSVSVVLIKAGQSKAEEHDMKIDGNHGQSITENEQEEHDDNYNDDDDGDDVSSNNDDDTGQGHLNSDDETAISIGFCEESIDKYELDTKDNNDHTQVEGNIDTGNVEKYIPPHLRKQTSSETKPGHLNRITCQMKGLLNR